MKVTEALDRIAERFGYTAPTQRSALLARQKQVQKMGWPASTKTARGAPSGWNGDAYRDLLILSELRHLGIPPQVAIEIATAHRDELEAAYESGGRAVLHTAAYGGKPTRSAIVIDFSEE